MEISKEERLWEAATRGDLATVVELTKDPSVDVNWRDIAHGRSPLYRACGHGRLSVVLHLLKNPRVDPNLPMIEDATPLYVACQQGNVAVVRALLTDPRVDVNLPDNEGIAPFSIACAKGQVSMAWLLLADPRIDPNVLDHFKNTPLWIVAQYGHVEVAHAILASGRYIDTQQRSLFENRTAAEHGRAMAWTPQQPYESDRDVPERQENGPTISRLIDAYDKDRERVRAALRTLPLFRDRFIGYTFAMAVFFSDSYVVLGPEASRRVVRFFSIMASLPLDLQMVLSNRIFGSSKDIVTYADSEIGFKWMARPLEFW